MTTVNATVSPDIGYYLRVYKVISVLSIGLQNRFLNLNSEVSDIFKIIY
jgi:hypothetical protein